MSETEKRDLSSLSINFLADSTFKLSKDTPYFFDTVGYWLPGTSDAYDYNRIYFGTIDKEDEDISFYAPYNESGDTIFLMQETMPKPNHIGLGKIIFKKCNCGNR